jgi:CheY-like chemotaxis protein
MRVLLVEDNPELQEDIATILGFEGFTVDRAGDGLVALDLARRVPPDLILADLLMPELNGFELRAELIQYPELRDIPYLILSARATEQDRRRASELGVTTYIRKPCEARELVRLLRSALD